jgi:MFS family permease
MRLFHGWQVVVAALVGAALSPATLVNVPFGLFAAALEAELHWGRPETTAALSVFLALLVVSLPIAGWLVDRVGARRVALVSILAYGLALASIRWVAPSPAQLYVHYGLIAILGAGAQSLTFIRVLSAWFDRRRGLAIGACMAGYGLGYVLVPILAQAMIARHGWRTAYGGLGALAVFGAFPIVALLLRDVPTQSGTAPHAGLRDRQPATTWSSAEIRKLLSTRELWLMGLTFLLMSAALNGVQSQLVPLLTDEHMDAVRAAWMLSVVGLGSFPGRLLIGFLLDKAFAPFVAVAFFMPAALALLWLADGGLPPGVALCAIAIGLSLGAENDLLGYLVGRYFDLKWFGQIYSVLLATYLLGAALGSYLMARAYAAAGSYNGALRAGSVAIGVCCALLLCLRRYPLGGPRDA